MLPRPLLAAALALAALGVLPAQAADPDILWKLVHEQCVPREQQHAAPLPCTLVDLRQGVEAGYAVLKDIKGATQYLVIPTARITGIEDPLLLRPNAPNYFAVAWRERGYTEKAAGKPLPRDALSLAVNSAFGRSQDQLHIHIDCIRPDVRAALHRQLAAIGDRWALLRAPLARHRYWAMRIAAEDLDGANPFKLLATQRPAAAAAMNRQTLVVAGAQFADGRPGFILLATELDLVRANRASGEELQDHTCALARKERPLSPVGQSLAR